MTKATNTARIRPGLFIGVAALLVLIVAAWWMAPTRDDASTAPDSTAAPADADAAPAANPGAPGRDTNSATLPRSTSSAIAASTVPEWPASLRDSEPDGGVTLDAGGRVQPSIELRRLFDYFLSAIGEIELAQIRALLLAHVRGLHGEGVAAEVAAVFDRYVAYQQSLAAMPAPPNESLRDRLTRVHELRRQLLDAQTADAFFAAEERYTEYTLDRRDLMADTTLDDATRTQRLATLDTTLSPEQRAQMQQANSAVLVDEQNRQFDALRLSPAQRHSEREALFGVEAAQRLAEVDAENAAWAARVASYRQARDAIAADQRLDRVARERALAQLRARSFDETERRRIQSLEAIGQL